MGRLNLLLAVMLLTVIRLYADTIPQEPLMRPLTATYRVDIGGMKALSTYLTPIPHTGTSYGAEGEWRRRLHSSLPLTQTYKARFGMGLLEDASHASAMTDIDLSFSWNLQYGFLPLPRLTLSAGAGVEIEGGLLYLPRNSNNPVAARASVDLTVNAGAMYDFSLRGYSLRVFDNVSLPSLGCFFSPHYGQSYFEIYMGDRSGVARCGWWGNHFMIDNLVGVEVPVKGIRLQLGYGLSVTSSYASHINTRITSHRCVIGISTYWINVTRRP